MKAVHLVQPNTEEQKLWKVKEAQTQLVEMIWSLYQFGDFILLN